MDKRTKICIWIILLGLANFVAYVILYWYFWGEAVNGRVELHAGQARYFLQSGVEVSRDVFIYSGMHSISIWPTVAAVMLSMLTLAKDQLIASMRSTLVRGRTFFTILATIIAFTTIVITIWFVIQFHRRISHPAEIHGPQSQPVVMACR